MMSQYGSQKRAAAKAWIAVRKNVKSSKKNKRTTPAYGIRSFTTQGPRIGAPLGAVLKSTFRVAGRFTANPGAAGAIYTQTFRVNDLFDPTSAIGADQPRGFDQLALLYQRYRVRNAKVNIQVCNQNTVATGASIVGFQFTDSSTAPTVFTDAIEQGYSVWKLIGPGLDGVANLTMSVDVAKFKGKSILDDELSALTTAAPADVLYCHMFIQAVDTGVDLTGLGVIFCIDFQADMFQPINVAAS